MQNINFYTMNSAYNTTIRNNCSINLPIHAPNLHMLYNFVIFTKAIEMFVIL